MNKVKFLSLLYMICCGIKIDSHINRVASMTCHKVETLINDSIRELVTWECKEQSEIMNVLANLKGSVARWNLNFWRLEQFYTNF